MPTPAVNGQLPGPLGVLLKHGCRSSSSFTPAISTEPSNGARAIAGSFCLFWGNGVVALPEVTSASAKPSAGPAASATAAAARSGPMAVKPCLRMIFPPQMPRPVHYRIGSVHANSLRCFTPPVKTSIQPGCTVRSSPTLLLVTNPIIWTTDGQDGDPALRHGQLLGRV